MVRVYCRTIHEKNDKRKFVHKHENKELFIFDENDNLLYHMDNETLMAVYKELNN